MPRKWCHPHSAWVFLAPLSKSHALRAIWGREFFKEILFPDDSRLYQKWEMKWTLTETLTLPSLSHVVKHSVKEYYCSDQDQWRFAQQQQNKLLFFFPAFWFALNTIRFVDRPVLSNLDSTFLQSITLSYLSLGKLRSTGMNHSSHWPHLFLWQNKMLFLPFCVFFFFLTASLAPIYCWLLSWYLWSYLHLMHHLSGPVHMDGFRFYTFTISFLTCSPSDIPDLGKHQFPKHLRYNSFLLHSTSNLQGKLLKK